MRTESDFIGSREIPDDALYGIHALRAKENFPDTTPFPEEWYRAIGIVKQACYITYNSFKKASLGKAGTGKLPVSLMEDEVIDTLIDMAGLVGEGEFFGNFIIPGISGGAGTSINMNVNEIIANAALIQLGKRPGDYSTVDPVEHANIFQSTNDVIPTSLKVALMFLLNDLEKLINALRARVEEKENAHRHDLRIGYTQMQEAVPTSFGKLFSTYSEALSRDWWRVSKCFERLKQVNLGGGAVGTGLAIPRFFIMEVVQNLQKLTGLPVARSENMPDTTSNLDSFVEVHAILKAHAVNLEKMVSDIRLLASDLTASSQFAVRSSQSAVGSRQSAVGSRQSKQDSEQRTANSQKPAAGSQLSLPPRQAGSSIMPGKINPVIPEFVISAAHKIYSNDQLITSLSAQGCLELNAYLPVIGCALIESLRLLNACDHTLKDNLITDLKVGSEASIERLFSSPSITTALVPYIGYHKASELARLMKSNTLDIFAANKELALFDERKLKKILLPENLLKMGYVLKDLE